MNTEAPDRREYSSFAIASLVLGILSVMGGALLLVPALLAVIFGHMAVSACNRDPQLDGKGLAIAGLILGWVSLAVVLIVFFGWIALFNMLSHVSY
jgi:sterol desaturase/sphingolipid hydroxylase (fatty acid hydroxylase superfamily)